MHSTTPYHPHGVSIFPFPPNSKSHQQNIKTAHKIKAKDKIKAENRV
jgi:hypothetical protein